MKWPLAKHEVLVELQKRIIDYTTHQFAADNLIHIVRLTQHDLAQQHVFQCCECSDIRDAVVSFEGFIEIRESGFEIAFVGCMQDARLQIE